MRGLLAAVVRAARHDPWRILAVAIAISLLTVFAAVRRSAHLVRQKFWWVVLLATLPLAVVSELESLAPEPHSVGAALETLAIRGLGTGVLEAVIGLVLVELAYQLIALDRTSAAIGPADARRLRSPEPG